uniref:Uncharacterized protein n=1 Tax=Anguilla anguilla TaxID=7936 RepID=A0A0E9U1K0_ANGAN
MIKLSAFLTLPQS